MAMFRVLTDFVARTAGFESGISRMESKTRGWSKNTQQSFRAVGLAATAMGYAITRALTAAVARGTQFHEMGQAAGVAARDLSRLSFAATQSGLTFEQFTTGLIRLNKNMGEAVRGTMESKEAFDAIGVSLVDATGKMRAPADVLSDLADKFSSMEDGASKTMIAMRLFGKAGATMIPLLNEGASGIEALAKQADALGLTMENDAAKAAEVFGDQMAMLKGVATGFSNMLMASLIPGLSALALNMEKSATSTSAFRDAAFVASGALKGLISLALSAATVFGILGRGIGAAAAAVAAAAQGDFKRAFSILNDDARSGVEALRALKADLAALWTTTAADVGGGADGAAGKIAAPMILAAEKAKVAAKDLEQYLNQAITIRNDAIRALSPVGNLNPTENTQAINAYFENVRRQGLEIKDTFEEVNDSMTVFAQQAARNMQDAFADFFYNMDGGFKGMVRGFADALRKMIANLLASQLLDFIGGWLGGMGGVLGKIGGAIGKRASGGPVSGGTPYLVGERGPELFVPGASGSVVPNSKLGGVTIAPTYNIDARGATTDLIRSLPGILAENNRQLMVAWRDAQSRGAFA